MTQFMRLLSTETVWKEKLALLKLWSSFLSVLPFPNAGGVLHNLGITGKATKSICQN